jgi:3-hydroxybutyryl-CoA dehydrogenase
MKKISIIGAGTMGCDIAQVFALKGFEVTVRDITDEIVGGARAKLEKALDRLVEKGKLEQPLKDEALTAVTFTTDLNQVQIRIW